MAAEMEFCLLGPLMVRCGRVVVALPPGKQRTVLAALLLNAGHVVSLDELAEVLWGASPPPSARVTMQNYVMRLRKALGGAGSRISTQPPGYLIRADADELDVSFFQSRLDAAVAAARGHSWQAAAKQARAGLAVWRGEPLAGVESELLAARDAPRLAELRLRALEIGIDADLHLGRHAEVITELRELAGANPLRERLHGLLMLALYRDGRQAEALAAYQHARSVLVQELGVEPGPGLRDLHQRILSADPTLAITGPARPAKAEPQWDTPRELPPAVPGFTGRLAEFRALNSLPDRSGQQGPGTVVISAIGGTAGVGKTALAIHWAHHAAARFGDGQLYVNLRGFDPSGIPVTPAEAIRGFLDALGVPPERIPAGQDAQAGLYRRLLTDRKMPIVLDNARDEGQVRPLLPASPASVVIITSRSQLTGLAAADGARLLRLDLMPHGEAVQLLTTRVGDARAAAEPGAASEIATMCARLPLALAVAAAQAAARPGIPLSALASELRDAAGRLDVLEAGDPGASVAAVFSWSTRQLSNDAARMFRLLGLHPGPDISVHAAASLAAVNESQARRLLRELTRHCLVTEHTPGRYAFHDLLRAYAASQARDHDSAPDRDAAVGRILDHYLHTAAHATFLLQSAREKVDLAVPRRGVVPEQPGDHRQALAWFEAEHQVLLAAVTMALDMGADSHAWQLPRAMAGYLYRRGYQRERVTILGNAVAAATRLDDIFGQATSLRALGSACIGAGDYDQARVHLERCLLLYQRLDDRQGQAWTHVGFSRLAEVQGRYADALDHGEQALGLYQAIGDQSGEALVLNSLAWDHALLGDYLKARAFAEWSLGLITKLSDCDFECHVWATLGYTALHLGDSSHAAAHFESALSLCRDYGDRYSEAEILLHAGNARHAAGDLLQARQAWQQALAIYHDLQHPDADKVHAQLASTKGQLPAC
jgi:DNA-binding SARP family transcriptional activator/tetratricopeptide (TPR) repeat protein